MSPTLTLGRRPGAQTDHPHRGNPGRNSSEKRAHHAPIHLWKHIKLVDDVPLGFVN